MDAKQFYEEHANNTWWNASTDIIEIKADDLWKLMDEYTMHLAKNISSNAMLAEVPERKFEWVCNECNFANFTSSVSQDEIDAELHACINCGGFEFHKRHFR